MKSLSPMSAGSSGLAVKGRNFSRLAVVSLFCFFFLAMLVTPAFAQEATIVGTVTDPSGASVAGATITVTNIDKGLSRTLTTSSDGQYVAPDLGLGHYTVRAESKGFKVVEQKGIVLNVNDRVRADFKLELGTAQENVTVEAATIAVQTDTGEVSDVITGQQMSQLATNGRSMYSLISLTPGASSGQGDFQMPTPVGGDANVSFNGMRESHNLYLLDGSESSDRGGAGGSDVMPSMDAIAEFRQMTSNYSAEFGLSSAATMTAVIKSGSKTLHASAWEFLRNDALDAKNYFTGKTPLKFHTFGFNAGGPIDFWKKEHNSFFFYNMEWRRLIQGQTLNTTVPSTAWYGGALPSNIPISVPANVDTAILSRVGQPGGCTNLNSYGLPGTLQPGGAFTSNTIPTCMLDPNSQLLLQAGIFPKNNSVNSKGQPTFVGGNNVPTHVREEIVRIDHNFTSKFSVFGHFVDEKIDQNFGTSMWSGDNVPTSANTFGNPSYSAVIHTTYVISPTLLNEVAFNYNGNRINILPTGIIARPSGFVSTELFPGNNDNRIPEIHLDGYNGTDYTTASWPWKNVADDYQLRDDVSWTKGAHQFKMGASWAIYKKIQDLFGNTQGSFDFKNNFTGNDFADFLLGTATSYGELAVQDRGHWDNVSWALYGQDNWRATKRLTLNLGLRWDGVPHTYEENNRMGNFYPSMYNQNTPAVFVAGSNGNAIDPSSPGLGPSPNPILKQLGYQFYLNGIGIPGQNGVPKGLVDNQWAAFGPRLGFAYDLTGSGKTVVRGGFGTMYERIQGNDMYNAGPNIPFSTNVSFNNVYLDNPSTDLGSGNTLVAPITVASITGLDKKQNKLPLTSQYSLGVQHSLSARTVLSVSYVGNQSRHQNDYRETNLPDPSTFAALFAANGTGYNTYVPYRGFNSIKMSENVQNSHYNGLQMEIHSQIKHDLNLQGAYTYSKAHDPATSGNGVSDLNSISNPYNHGYDSGPSGLDRTHIAFLNFVYDIPLLRDSPNKALKAIVGGWQVSGIVTWVSGEPLNITEGGITNCAQGANNGPKCTTSLIGTGSISNIIPNANNRPDVNGSVSAPHTVASWFANTVVKDGSGNIVSEGPFTPTVAGTWGNEPFNALRGPSRQNWNLAMFKSFLFSESRGSRLEFRAEFFNAFNHTEWNTISTTYSSGDFGNIKSTHDPREIQLALKLYF